MFKVFSFILALGIFSNLTMHGAADSAHPPLRVGSYTVFYQFATKFFCNNGKDSRIVKNLAELRDDEIVTFAEIQDGAVSYGIDISLKDPKAIMEYINQEMKKYDPAFPISTSYLNEARKRATKQTADIIIRGPLVVQPAKPAPTVSAFVSSRERYIALNLQTGEQRYMAHKDDLREGEILNGVELR